MTVFLVERFYGSLVADKSNDYLTVFGIGPFIYDNYVAVEDSRFYHTFPFYVKGEKILGAATDGRSAEAYVSFEIFLCEDRLSCGYATDDGYLI